MHNDFVYPVQGFVIGRGDLTWFVVSIYKMVAKKRCSYLPVVRAWMPVFNNESSHAGQSQSTLSSVCYFVTRLRIRLVQIFMYKYIFW